MRPTAWRESVGFHSSFKSSPFLTVGCSLKVRNTTLIQPAPPAVTCTIFYDMLTLAKSLRCSRARISDLPNIWTSEYFLSQYIFQPSAHTSPDSRSNLYHSLTSESVTVTLLFPFSQAVLLRWIYNQQNVSPFTAKFQPTLPLGELGPPCFVLLSIPFLKMSDAPAILRRTEMSV